MALMRASTIFGFLALLAGTSCFNGEPDAPLISETFVGTYIYYAADKTEPHDPDELTLHADGTYTLVYKPSGRQGAREEGRWQLYVDSHRPEILIDLVGHWVRTRGRVIEERGQLVVDSCRPVFLPARAGYHVWIKGRNVRLEISSDLGHWYQKIG